MAKLVFIAVGYAISSSMLVVINKWALLKWPYASTLTFVQLTVSWVCAFALGKMNIVQVDPLDPVKVKAFAPACLIFYIAIACNLKLLQYANVDTFIVLRSLVPLATTLAESFALGTKLPNRRVFATLIMIVLGSMGYVYSDKQFSLTAYSWGAAYIFTMVVDTILVKKVVTDVELTPWGLVFYNNLIASALYPFFAYFTGELNSMSEAFSSLLEFGDIAFIAVMVSCVFGISISYFGLNARKILQATAFSVLGVVCKFATVFVNTVLWEYHATPQGIFFLLVCISGGILYQQEMKAAVMTVNVQKDAEDKARFKQVPLDDPSDDAFDPETSLSKS